MNGAQIFDQQAQMLGFLVHGLKRFGCEGRHIIPQPPGISCDHTNTSFSQRGSDTDYATWNGARQKGARP